MDTTAIAHKSQAIFALITFHVNNIDKTHYTYAYKARCYDVYPFLKYIFAGKIICHLPCLPGSFVAFIFSGLETAA